MNKKLLIGAAIIIVAAGAAVFFVGKDDKGGETQVISGEQTSFDPRNASYEIEGETFVLANGVFEKEAAPGSASKVTVRYFGNVAKGDLNGDGREDMAYLITKEGGGSGLFYYAVAALKTENGYEITNAFFIGDRIAPQSTYIPANSMEVQVAYAERKPGEPMTARPSVGAVKLLKVTAEGVLEGLME